MQYAPRHPFLAPETHCRPNGADLTDRQKIDHHLAGPAEVLDCLRVGLKAEHATPADEDREPRCGHDDIKAFMIEFRAAFPDLAFAGSADLIAEGDYVVGRWIGGTHTGPAFGDFLAGLDRPRVGAFALEARPGVRRRNISIRVVPQAFNEK